MIRGFVLDRAASLQFLPVDTTAPGRVQSVFHHGPIQLQRRKLSVAEPVVAVTKRSLPPDRKDYLSICSTAESLEYFRGDKRGGFYVAFDRVSRIVEWFVIKTTLQKLYHLKDISIFLI